MNELAFNIMRSSYLLHLCVGLSASLLWEVFDTYYFQLQVLCAGTMVASLAAAQIPLFDTVCVRRVRSRIKILQSL